jgi:hypothetical protein
MRIVIVAITIFSLILIFELIFLGKYVWNGSSISESIAMATTVKPETFTELYFEDHLKLPKDTILEKSNSFKFTVHNLEYKDMDYPYEVYIASSGGKLQMIDKGTFTLKHDQYQTVLERYTLEEEIKRAKVVVDLTSKKQQIDFWIGEENK